MAVISNSGRLVARQLELTTLGFEDAGTSTAPPLDELVGTMEALKLVREWLSLVDIHIRDSDAFKADLILIDAALQANPAPASEIGDMMSSRTFKSEATLGGLTAKRSRQGSMRSGI